MKFILLKKFTLLNILSGLYDFDFLKILKILNRVAKYVQFIPAVCNSKDSLKEKGNLNLG